MRILSLVFSFLVTALLATVALTYLERRIGQQRIYVQDDWLSADQKMYRSYGEAGTTRSDRTRYYWQPSHSERSEESLKATLGMTR